MLHLIFATFVLVTSSSWATQSARVLNENPLEAQATTRPHPITAGGRGSVEIRLHLPKGHHAYADQFRLSAPDSTLFRVGGIEITPLHDFMDPFSKKLRKVMEESAVLLAPLDISPDILAQNIKLKLELSYQACTKDYCLFPKTIEVPLEMMVISAGPKSEPRSLSQRLNEAFQKSLAESTLWAFILVFLAGVLTSLTPCIFPMIPITLAVLGARHTTSVRRRFSLSVLYVLGIAITYSVMGLVVGLTGAVFGAFLGNPVVISALALVFVAMGVAMLGGFEVALPAGLQTVLSAKKFDQGLFGAFATGLVAGLIASPCVGPVLVSILTFVAQTRNAGFGFALLFVFAIGMGQLFLLLGASTSFVERLPKSGPWMDEIKRIFAVIFFALSVWYVRPLISDAIYHAALAVLMCVSAVVLGLFQPGMPKGGAAILYRTFLMGVLFVGVYFGAMSAQEMWPTDEADKADAHKAIVPWQPFSEQAMRDAIAAKRPIIIDFWAEWCVACHELEMNTFPKPDVQNLSGSFVWLKFDATRSSDLFQKLKTQYQILGLPHLVFYDTKGEERKDLTLTGYENARDFAARMKQALNIPYTINPDPNEKWQDHKKNE